MILEVTVKLTKLATFSNFSGMFLRTNNWPQKVFESDIDLCELMGG